MLEGNGHKRTQREGLCTGTAKGEPRYDIYLEQTAVYRYIVAALMCIIAKLHRTDLIIYSHYREGKACLTVK